MFRGPNHEAQQASYFQALHRPYYSALTASSRIGDMDNSEECERFIDDLMDEDGGSWGFYVYLTHDLDESFGEVAHQQVSNDPSQDQPHFLVEQERLHLLTDKLQDYMISYLIHCKPEPYDDQLIEKLRLTEVVMRGATMEDARANFKHIVGAAREEYGTASTPRCAACLLIDNEVYANLAEGPEPVPEWQDDEDYVDIVLREKGVLSRYSTWTTIPMRRTRSE